MAVMNRVEKSGITLDTKKSVDLQYEIGREPIVVWGAGHVKIRSYT